MVTSPTDVLQSGWMAMNMSSDCVTCKFENSQCDSNAISALDGLHLCREEGELCERNSANDSPSFVGNVSVKSHGGIQLHATVMNYVVKQASGNHFCLMAMIILGGLVASNIVSLGVLAVTGGQPQLITCLNLIFSMHFCFNHIQKRKRAWKQRKQDCRKDRATGADVNFQSK